MVTIWSIGGIVVIFIGGDWVQLSEVDHELQRRQWIESGTERHVYKSTMSRISEKDGEDLPSR
jgi:hypothetical protein